MVFDKKERKRKQTNMNFGKKERKRKETNIVGGDVLFLKISSSIYFGLRPKVNIVVESLGWRLSEKNEVSAIGNLRG
ncbi:hypothetical protein A3SI_08831 [Nitritalea halalkaliphila LW7]|uniref:Uncharacterized protein n=1 Tax=Nitritalea halalkaliphila LW7 TaxID=1189621 RepID=I5C4P3_9BACT|nr:hypothetical protein [Nitritalea halalkaliphila]EIM76795.1 hypothetical protein A3SI_08831 [Nitritalea halalkaliphila LW7]